MDAWNVSDQKDREIGNQGPQPLSLTVPIYNCTEVDLMRALEQVAQHFNGLPYAEGGEPPLLDKTRRAVDWLHAKYGTQVAA
jgi:hypothetical protein